MNSISKVVFWNVWGHRYADGIHGFLEQHSDADVFCLTEVTDVSQRQIDKNGHNLVYSGGEAAAQVDGLAQLHIGFDQTKEVHYATADYRNWKCTRTGARFSKVGFGSALLIARNITIIKHGVHLVDFKHRQIKNRVVQWVVYQKGSVRFLLAHLHGVWIKGNTKGDHLVRTQQSQEVRQLLRNLVVRHEVDKVIFGGDLNLHLNTKALDLIEFGEELEDSAHLRNLIREFDIRNTRTKKYRDYHKLEAALYADYVFVSEEMTIHSFAVHNDVLASDHAPLVVECS